MKGSQFAEFAETQCGKGADTFRSYMKLGKNSSWSAAFVSYCAIKCNVSSTIIPVSSKCQDIADNGINPDCIGTPGTWLPGPCEGSQQEPKSGDIALFSWSSNASSRADCVGIVRSYDKEDNSIQVVIGDYGTKGSNSNKVRITSYDASFRCIKGYFRPSWDGE